MADLDIELVARALQWCAESGRRVSEKDVRDALATLGWDELLAVRAQLADPPPARSLGPAELVALALRPPADAPARERPSAGEPEAPARASRTRGRAAAARGPNIRKAADRPAEPGEPAPLRLPLDDLYREEGRAELERAIRRLGANRVALLAEFGATWAQGDGSPPGAADLDGLLAHHRLARGFEEREKSLLLHQLRRAGGIRVQAARALGWSVDEVDAAVRRLRLSAPVSALREARRKALLAKATLAERARILDEQGEALEDLGLSAEVIEDLRRRIPEHLRALGGSPAHPPTRGALGRSLSLSREAMDRLDERLGLSLPVGRAPPRTSDRAPGRSGGRPPGRPQGRPSARPPGRSLERPPGRASDRPAGRTAPPSGRPRSDRSGGQSSGRPADRSGPRPRGRPGAGRTRRPL